MGERDEPGLEGRPQVRLARVSHFRSSQTIGNAAQFVARLEFFRLVHPCIADTCTGTNSSTIKFRQTPMLGLVGGGGKDSRQKDAFVVVVN